MNNSTDCDAGSSEAEDVTSSVCGFSLHHSTTMVGLWKQTTWYIILDGNVGMSDVRKSCGGPMEATNNYGTL